MDLRAGPALHLLRAPLPAPYSVPTWYQRWYIPASQRRIGRRLLPTDARVGIDVGALGGGYCVRKGS